MNVKKNIIYAGGFRLPDRTASAQRVMGNSRLFELLGYSVVLIGKIGDESGDYDDRVVGGQDVGGFRCEEIRGGDTEGIFRGYEWDMESVRRVAERYGVENVFAIVAYNYPAIALSKINQFCKDYEIASIAECTEWYGFEGPGLVQNTIRFLLSEMRMRWSAKRSRNVICSNNFLASRFLNCNTVVVPFVVDTASPKWSLDMPKRSSATRRFIYAGSPGIGMSKDLLYKVIEGFVGVKKSGLAFEFVVVGLSRGQYLDWRPGDNGVLEYLEPELMFRGRLTHEETIAEIRQSDWFVFLRPDNRVSRAGFPTKLAEAFSCGIPTITNATSDIGLYVRNGVNGILLNELSTASVENALIEGVRLSRDRLDAMKNDCMKNNPFVPERFADQMGEFLGRVR